MPGRSRDAGRKQRPGAAKPRWRALARWRAPSASARPRQLPLYDVRYEFHDSAVARHADEAAVVGVDPVAERALGRQAVELGALDGDVKPRVACGVLRDGYR